MSAIYKNGIAYGGAASSANLISATDASGEASNVQAQLNSLNDDLANINTKLNNMQVVSSYASAVTGQCIFNVSNSFRGILIAVTTTETTCGLYFLVSTSTGMVGLYPIKASTTVLSFDNSEYNKLTISASSGTVRIVAIGFGGTVSLVE